MTSLFLLLAACLIPTGSTASSVATSSPLPTGTTTPGTGVTTGSATWSMASGWSLQDGYPVDDLTGDGTPDLVVHLRGPDLETYAQWVVVAGPATNPMTLPDDAWASPPAWENVTAVLDATGDGVADMVTVEQVFAGPLPRGELSGGLALAPSETVLDVTGDGIGDRILDQGGGVTVWSGPLSMAGAAPTVVVQAPCEADSEHGLLGDVFPDLTGDGWAELHLPGSLGYDDCGGWLLSASPGTTDPTTAPDVVQGLGWWNLLTVVGDQNGDGFRDARFETPAEILYGPLSFAGGALTAAGSATLPMAVEDAVRIPADLDGDGMGEFLTWDFELDGELLVAAILSVHLGGQSLTTAAAPYGTWRYEAENPVWFMFVATGQLYLALASDEPGHGVTLMDLGPADPLAITE